MKVPPQAKSVFKGEIFEVFQWPQLMFDGTTATFEMIKRPSSVDVIPVTADGQILIAEQEQPLRDTFESLFGGMIDAGELPLQAAQRELQEESGYTSTEWEQIVADEPFHKMEYTNYIFVARNVKKEHPQDLDAGEKISIKAISFKTFLDRLNDPKFRISPQFRLDVLKMRWTDPDALEKFREKLGAS